MTTTNFTSKNLPEMSDPVAAVPPAPLPPLDTESPGLLARLERQLQTGTSPLSTKAMALATIKARGLARLHGLSFPAYCDQRLRLKRSRLHQLLEFADLLGGTTSGGLAPADNERQLRPLKKLPRADWTDAWAEVLRTALNGKITGKHVQAVVDGRLARQHAAGQLVPLPVPPTTAPATASALVDTVTPVASTTPTPPARPAEMIRTVPAPEVKLPGWKPEWQKIIRAAPRPHASLGAGFFGWQPAD